VLADILAGAAFDKDVGQGTGETERTEEQGRAHHPWRDGDLVACGFPVKRRYQRQMLQWIDHVDQVGERKTVGAEHGKVLFRRGRHGRVQGEFLARFWGSGLCAER